MTRRLASQGSGSTPQPARRDAPASSFRQRLQSFSYRLQYVGLLALSCLARLLPRATALSLGAALGQLGWSLRLRRRIVLANLEQALPHLSPPEWRRIAARAARNFGRTSIEFLRFTGADRERVGELVEIEGLDELRRARGDDRGVVIVTGHLGAWALYVTALAARGVEVALLVGQQHNPFVDDLIHGIPGDAVRFVSKGRPAVRRILGCLRSGVSVVMVADQHAGRSGIRAPFLRRAASTLALPAAFVERHRVPLFLMAGHRVEGGRHRVVLRPVEVCVTGDEDERRREITTRLNQELGEAILERPDQYFWYHRRWRESDSTVPVESG